MHERSFHNYHGADNPTLASRIRCDTETSTLASRTHCDVDTSIRASRTHCDDASALAFRSQSPTAFCCKFPVLAKNSRQAQVSGSAATLSHTPHAPHLEFVCARLVPHPARSTP
eukprot:365964-Chlamydomonas_euryale.AAC.4